jgi:hypothetical protein
MGSRARNTRQGILHPHHAGDILSQLSRNRASRGNCVGDHAHVTMAMGSQARIPRQADAELQLFLYSQWGRGATSPRQAEAQAIIRAVEVVAMGSQALHPATAEFAGSDTTPGHVTMGSQVTNPRQAEVSFTVTAVAMESQADSPRQRPESYEIPAVLLSQWSRR